MPDENNFARDEVRVFTKLKNAGIIPKTVFDIGAARGAWSALLSGVFPEATYHMFEPLASFSQEYAASLKWQMERHPEFHLHNVALGARTGKIAMRVHADMYSSTILDLGPNPDYETRHEVMQFQLDQFVAQESLPLPDIIKIDTQGAEYAILSQAKKCLAHASVVFAETWLMRGYGPETPLLTELRDFLNTHDFDLVELGGRFYDASHVLYGCDAFFVKRNTLQAVNPSMPQSVPW